MARAYSLDLRERVVAAVAAGASLPGGGGAVRGQRGERGEVVAAVRGRRQRGGQADGRQAALRAGGRARLAAGAAGREAGPDVAGAAGGAGRARRSRCSYYAVWHFFEHEGISFKKKPARQRAGSAGRGAPARAVEEVSGAA